MAQSDTASRKLSEKQLAANRANAARSTGPRTPEGKARSAQNARKHGFTATSFAVVRAEDIFELADIQADLVSVYQPVNSEELAALERIALARQALLRVSRLEAGLFSCGVNEAVDSDAAFRTQPNLDITLHQGFNHILADGFLRILHQNPDAWKLFLRYQAQAQRNYRHAIEDLDRLRSLRDELPNEPVDDQPPQPEPLRDPGAPHNQPQTEPAEAPAAPQNPANGPAEPQMPSGDAPHPPRNPSEPAPKAA